MDVSAIILMGGEGKRFSSTLPKQFHKLSGKKVYLYTLETFLKSHLFKEILLVCHKNHIKDVLEETKHFKTPTQIKIIEGGSTRQSSSYKGTMAASFEYVVIHDSVRPFVSMEILENNVKALKSFNACDTCIPSADTLVYTQDQSSITSIPNRSHYLRGQTPQSFKKNILLKAHDLALKQGITNASDDCQLVLNLNTPIHVVQGSEENMKITSFYDLSIAEHLLRHRTSSLKTLETLSLKDKTFVVTGATGGIGKQICHLLKKEQAQVIPLSLSSKHYPIDLTNFEQTQKLFASLEKTYGPFDGLINSVGFLKIMPLKKLHLEDLKDLIEKNFTATAHSCMLCPLKKEAHIINIASSSYFRGRENYAVYSAMKAATVNFTQGLAEEMPLLSINSLIPSRTLTKMRLDNFPKEDVSTLLDPKKVAEKVLDILRTKNITGMTIQVK